MVVCWQIVITGTVMSVTWKCPLAFLPQSHVQILKIELCSQLLHWQLAFKRLRIARTGLTLLLSLRARVFPKMHVKCLLNSASQEVVCKYLRMKFSLKV